MCEFAAMLGCRRTSSLAFVMSIALGMLLSIGPVWAQNRPFDGRPPSQPGGSGDLPFPDVKLPDSPNPPSLIPDHGSTFGSPANNKVWKCSKCGAVLGTGPSEPKIERCPGCGTKLTSWFQYYVLGGLGGAVLAGLVIIRIIMRVAGQRRT